MSLARLVLPTPGGPHKIMECIFFALNAICKDLLKPKICSWPTTSSIRVGRMTSAKGFLGQRSLE